MSPKMTQKKVVPETGAVVKVRPEPETVKSTSGSWITPPNESIRFRAVPGRTPWAPAAKVKSVVEPSKPPEI